MMNLKMKTFKRIGNLLRIELKLKLLIVYVGKSAMYQVNLSKDQIAQDALKQFSSAHLLIK